jgi:hypothetical protein
LVINQILDTFAVTDHHCIALIPKNRIDQESSCFAVCNASGKPSNPVLYNDKTKRERDALRDEQMPSDPMADIHLIVGEPPAFWTSRNIILADG